MAPILTIPPGVGVGTKVAEAVGMAVGSVVIKGVDVGDISGVISLPPPLAQAVSMKGNSKPETANANGHLFILIPAPEKSYESAPSEIDEMIIYRTASV
jgi:hypothetical protein